VRTCTVIGARGFIGSRLASELRRRGYDVGTPDREAKLEGPLGEVFYCAGVTADFRSAPYRTVRAHVTDLVPFLESADFECLTYLSSTRVYGRAPADTREEVAIQVRPPEPDHLYNISKAMGESLVLSSGRPVRVVRLSNVFGVDLAFGNFIAQVVRDALTESRVILRTALDSEKDYVPVDKVVEALVGLAERGALGVYNLASGCNTTHAELLGAIRARTSCAVEVLPGAPTVRFPRIAIERLRAAIPWAPGEMVSAVGPLVDAYANALSGRQQDVAAPTR
jgi:nucleoside-diphosphate-sugar epimerase